MSEADPQALTADQVRARLKAETDAAGTMKAWADAHKVSPAYVADVLASRRDPGRTILEALGLQKEIRFREQDKALG